MTSRSLIILSLTSNRLQLFSCAIRILKFLFISNGFCIFHNFVFDNAFLILQAGFWVRIIWMGRSLSHFQIFRAWLLCMLSYLWDALIVLELLCFLWYKNKMQFCPKGKHIWKTVTFYFSWVKFGYMSYNQWELAWRLTFGNLNFCQCGVPILRHPGLVFDDISFSACAVS